MTRRTLGWVTGSHGLRGEVTLKVCDPEAPWLTMLTQVELAGPKGTQVYTIQAWRRQGQKIIIHFQGITDCNTATTLKGHTVQAAETDLPSLAPETYYIDQIIGLSLVSEAHGHCLGTVKDVLSNHEQDFLEITTPQGDAPVLVPFQAPFVVSVDTTKSCIVVSGLDSLFETSLNEPA